MDVIFSVAKVNFGKLVRFEIEFADTNDVYFAGDIVNGNVIIQLTERMDMQSIRLEIRGTAYAHWTEAHSHSQYDPQGRRRSSRMHDISEQQYIETVHYYGEEEYLWDDVILMEKVEGQRRSLAAGTHVIPFEFILPPNSPTSFEGLHGYVRYQLRAIIEKPWKYDHVTKSAFTVIGLVDLNEDPVAAKQNVTKNAKTIGTLCCKQGNLECEAVLSQTGFVPGDTINLKVRVNNESQRAIDKVKVAVEQISDYFGVSEHRKKVHTKQSVRTLISHQYLHEIEPGAMTEIDFSKHLRVPSVPPTFSTSAVLHIHYVLKVRN